MREGDDVRIGGRTLSLNASFTHVHTCVNEAFRRRVNAESGMVRVEIL